MSSATVLSVTPNQRPVELLELKNSHGWAPSIWRRLLKERYGYGYDEYLFNNDLLMNRLWREVEELPDWQQAPLVLTFDTGVVPREELTWAAEQLEEFNRRLPEPDGYTNHVLTVARLLRGVQLEQPLLGVYCTSVSENSFDPWDVEGDAPGSGIPLSDMYVLERHRPIVARALPEDVERDPRDWKLDDGQ